MIKIGNAPCSWGIIETIEQNRFSRDEVLSQIHESGYEGSELGDWGFLPTDPVALRDMAQKYQLKIMASWVSVHLHKKDMLLQDLDACMRVAKLLNAVNDKETVCVVLGNDPFSDEERVTHTTNITEAQHLKRIDPESWKGFLSNADEIAKRVHSETGAKVVFHHHTGTWIETPEEIKDLLEGTNELRLCFDTGHYAMAGGDAVEGIKTFSSRIEHVHFKDCSDELLKQGLREKWDAIKYYHEGIFPELGKGTIDFPQVMKEIQGMQYDGWIIVEQDILDRDDTDPFQSAIRNREYIRTL